MTTTKILALGALIATMTTPAFAFGHQGGKTCYRQETSPAVYRTVAETIMVSPARTVAEVIPAQYQIVQERVMVSPARKVWEHKLVHGKQVLCEVEVPAQFRTVERTVMVSPARTVHRTIPAHYETRHRQVMVQPASARWVKMHGLFGHCH
jgi:hypothetical protein